ncbi:hypothetical protein AAG747_03755 [Rapidithrix thailandica]|uniref:Uncharacterized protein n=1 Tax=Rapidithrix thailandica TaxID=413964 RepID=A0AAW9S1L0_9BACT
MPAILEFYHTFPVLSRWLGLALLYLLVILPGMVFRIKNWNTKRGALIILGVSPYYFAFAASGQEYFWKYLFTYGLSWWVIFFYDLELIGRTKKTKKMDDGEPVYWLYAVILWGIAMQLGIIVHFIWIFADIITFFKTDLSISIWILFGILYVIVTIPGMLYKRKNWNSRKFMLIVLYLAPVYFCWTAFSEPHFWSHLIVFGLSWWFLWVYDQDLYYKTTYPSQHLDKEQKEALRTDSSDKYRMYALNIWALCIAIAIGFYLLA